APVHPGYTALTRRGLRHIEIVRLTISQKNAGNLPPAKLSSLWVSAHVDRGDKHNGQHKGSTDQAGQSKGDDGLHYLASGYDATEVIAAVRLRVVYITLR